jgi:hypothetical protein
MKSGNGEDVGASTTSRNVGQRSQHAHADQRVVKAIGTGFSDGNG